MVNLMTFILFAKCSNTKNKPINMHSPVIIINVFVTYYHTQTASFDKCVHFNLINKNSTTRNIMFYN